MAFNKKTHLRQNIDALKTAFTLDREDQTLVEPLAQVMAKLGVTKGMVVFGQDKLDVNTYMSEPYITANYSSYNGMNGNNINAVSYTHLDVYKRQFQYRSTGR